MNQNKQALMRAAKVIAVAVVLLAVLIVMRTKGQDGSNQTSNAGEQWEYLALAGPSTTNFTPTSNPRMKKDPSGAFAREAFVLEQHLDKLGANGWELVAVAGPPTDPAYYFKRRK